MKKVYVTVLLLCLLLVCMLGECGEKFDYWEWTEADKNISVELCIEETSLDIENIPGGSGVIMRDILKPGKAITTPVEAEALAKGSHKMYQLISNLFGDHELLRVHYYTHDNIWVFVYGPPGIFAGSPGYVAVDAEDGSFLKSWVYI